MYTYTFGPMKRLVTAFIAFQCWICVMAVGYATTDGFSDIAPELAAKTFEIAFAR